MLREIRIQNLGVIDDAVLELSAGLNVVTGETGAGKTMVVSGLGLLLGARADVGLVRPVRERPSSRVWSRSGRNTPRHCGRIEAGGDVEDGLILARTVSAGGRSRPTSADGPCRSACWGSLASCWWRCMVSPTSCGCVSQSSIAPFWTASPAGPSPCRWSATSALYDELHHVGAELRRLRELARDRAREVDVLRPASEEIEVI
jgi:DNA repair protein RecN (Recombination protein N)